MESGKNKKLLLPSGGYPRLKSFRLARLIYDITVHFAEMYVPADSRTRDQMVQAARSGVQNIAEGSVDAATSAKLELNLYNVARASLEELRLDYQDFLRQHHAPVWEKDDPLYSEFVALRISDKAGFKAFIRLAEYRKTATDKRMKTEETENWILHNTPYKSVLVANATLLLISAATYLLKRQIDSKAKAFLDDGGFSERMARMRRKNLNG